MPCLPSDEHDSAPNRRAVLSHLDIGLVRHRLVDRDILSEEVRERVGRIADGLRRLPRMGAPY